MEQTDLPNIDLSNIRPIEMRLGLLIGQLSVENAKVGYEVEALRVCYAAEKRRADACAAQYVVEQGRVVDLTVELDTARAELAEALAELNGLRAANTRSDDVDLIHNGAGDGGVNTADARAALGMS